jgi:uncharacterized protein
MSLVVAVKASVQTSSPETVMALTFSFVIYLIMAMSSVTARADDAVDATVVANVAKTTALAPLTKIIPVPLPSTTNSLPHQANSTVNTAAKPTTVDVSNGERLSLPTLNAPVIDQANILSAADNQQLSDKLRAIHDAGRAQIGLVLVKSTQGEPIFDYAGRLFTAWKLGDAKRDNGLLIVVAVQDRKIQILTGYGLEGIIPDVIASRIIREQITPQFKTGQYAAGLSAGIDRIDSILQQDPETAKADADQMKAQQGQHQSQGSVLSGGLILLLIVLVIIGQFTQMIFGRFLSSGGLAAAGVGIGLFTGAGLAGSLLVGGAVFMLLLVGILPFLSMFLGGGGGGRGGGFGGGYGGGGGSFGGGGASGSW